MRWPTTLPVVLRGKNNLRMVNAMGAKMSNQPASGPDTITAEDVRRASWIAFFAWVFAVYDFILFGTLLPEIGKHFGWSAAEQAALATWVAVGTAIVALAVGPV